MILLHGVSQVEKEPEGCTWNENLAWIVHLGKGWISWAIKMKDWVGKALRCRAPFSARGEQGGGRVWPPHQRAVCLHGRRLCPREQGTRTSYCCCSLPSHFPGTAIPVPPALARKGWWHSPPEHQVVTRIDSLHLVRQLQNLLQRLERWCTVSVSHCPPGSCFVLL